MALTDPDTVADDAVVDLAADRLRRRTAEVLAGDERPDAAAPAEVDPRDSLDVAGVSALGAGQHELSLREVVRAGGVRTLAVLFAVNLVDEFDRAAFAILGPEIQRSLRISDLMLAVAGTVSGFLVVVAAIPLGVLGDRTSRTRIVAFCSALWAVFGLLTGLVRNAWQLLATRVLTGVGKANEGPLQKPILADAYPIAGRSRVFAIHNLANPIGTLLGPALAAGIVALVDGPDAWRWVFLIMAVPGLVSTVAALTLREPPRGQYEQLAVLGEVAEPDRDAVPASLATAFARLKKVRTFYFALVGLGAVGFGLFTAPIFISLILDREFGLDATERGVVTTITAVGGLLGAVVGGVLGDRVARRSLPAVLRLAGAAIVLLGVSLPASILMPNVPLFVVVSLISSALTAAALVPVTAVFAATIPHRLRSTGFALIGLYLAGVGGVGGSVVSGLIAVSHGPTAALVVTLPPASLVGGLLIAYGSRYVDADVAKVAADLQEEAAESARLAAGGDLPALQIRNLDFSYGPVQVLFGVDLDVHRNEILALLGTNGAGKSTVLRAVSGLAVVDRGVVRLDGRDITYADAATRVAMGVVQMPGGKALFGSLTVRENLLAGAFSLGREIDRDACIDRALEPFPVLRERLGQRAGSLSGGEQQMLALAKALLLEPKVLLIDELSLGLAPVVVEELLRVVASLRDRGMTIVIVEQSVNVALSIADRAIFMEKGEVRFEGPAAELLERGDLLRAVFLGGRDR